MKMLWKGREYWFPRTALTDFPLLSALLEWLVGTYVSVSGADPLGKKEKRLAKQPNAECQRMGSVIRYYCQRSIFPLSLHQPRCPPTRLKDPSDGYSPFIHTWTRIKDIKHEYFMEQLSTRQGERLSCLRQVRRSLDERWLKVAT